MNSCLNALKSIVESCTYRERYCWGYLFSTSLNPSRGIWETVTTPTQFSLVSLCARSVQAGMALSALGTQGYTKCLQ